MQTRRKMTLSQALMLLAFLLLIILLRVVLPASLLGEITIAIILLGLEAGAFALLWQTPVDAQHRKLLLALYWSIAGLPLFAILMVSAALARTPLLQRLGLDAPTTFLLGLFLVWPLLAIPPIVLLRRKVQREHPMTDQEKEMRQTVHTMPTGWGMTPEEAINSGHFMFLLVVFFGGGSSILAGIAAIHLAQNDLEHLKNLIYLVGCLLWCLGGIATCFFGISQAVKYWRIGHRWREQAIGTVTIEGTFADWWIEEGMHNKALIKIQRKDDSSKMLLVGPALLESMPGIGEDVQIDYRIDSEAVVDVRPLAGAADTAPGGDEPAAEG